MSFLKTADTKEALKDAKVRLWHIPAKSPDLNPVEKFWVWVRKQLLKKDLADLMKGRPVPGRTASQGRVRRLLQSAKAQQVAKNISVASGRRPLT